MFGIRTPAKKMNVTVDIESEPPTETQKADGNGTFEIKTPVEQPTANLIDLDHQISPPQTEQAGPSKQKDEFPETSSVKRSVGEWELVKKRRSNSQQLKTPTPPRKTAPRAAPRPKPTTLSSQEGKPTARRPPAEATGSPPTQEKFANRTAEAKACLTKAKINLEASRNLKYDIKINVTEAVERLFQLVKESEANKANERTLSRTQQAGLREREADESDLKKQIEEHSKLLRENNERMVNLKEVLEKQTYASVAAVALPRRPEQTALHSIVVTAVDETKTGEEVLDRIRKVVNAKESGIAVEKIRKAKDRKVIVGFRTEEERQKVQERLKGAKELNVVEMKNKDPLVILKDVLKYNTDEDVLDALRNQSKGIPKELMGQKCEIAFKKQTRNPHTHHIVMRVSPKIWQYLVNVGSVQIDLQRVRVADQSPLVQCSLCLGYGHGRRFCKETVEKCCHCGGPHLKSECENWLADAPPSCPNCSHAKLDRVEHNAFSGECPIRRKWEALARATIAYC